MNRRSLDRRRFLKAVGATALSYPFLRGLPSFAQAMSDPRYLILVYTPCGVVRYLWGAQGPARGATTTTSPLTGATGAGAFRPTLQPLASSPATAVLPASTTDLTSQTIVLDGLNVGTANGSHEAGMAALWTGCFNSGGGNGATSVSIDQAIAQQVNAGHGFSTLPLQVRSAQDFSSPGVLTRMLYGSSGGTTGWVTPYDDPAVARGTVFQSVAGADAGPDPTNFIRDQMFAQLNTELTGLQTRLCTQDRLQLQSIQDQWNMLDTQLKESAAAAASCMQPGPPPAGYASPGTGPASEFPLTAKLQMDLLALAMACDLTRVGSIQFSTATSQVTHSWLGSNQTDIHHNYSHDGPQSLYSLGPDLYDTATYNTPLSPFPVYEAAADGGTGQLPAIDLWYCQQVAYLANRLASLKTASNKNLLSQSVICWGSELDMGAAHSHDDSPFILIGGGGGALKTGQLVQFPLNLANSASNAPPTGNRFHNDLLITLAQVMGLPMTTFGSPTGLYKGTGPTVDFVTGPIREILT